MLIKVRDFRDPVIKEITKAIEENAFWFDKNTKKHYTRVNPDKHEVKLGEYTSYRHVENNDYVFSGAKKVEPKKEETTWTEADERRWIEYKNEFARREAEQEAEAFRAKMEYENFLNRR